jgi:hypothetical protein
MGLKTCHYGFRSEELFGVLGDFAAGASHFVEERLHLGGILFAGAQLHAAGDVHRIGPHDADGFAYVFRR